MKEIFQLMKTKVKEANRQGLSFTKWLAPLRGFDRGVEFFPLVGRTDEESSTMWSASGCNTMRLTRSKIPLESTYTSTRTCLGRASVDVYGVA